MKRRTWNVLVMGLGLMVGAIGCKVVPTSSDGGQHIYGSQTDARRLPDVPVPRGYEFRKSRSFTYNRSFRTANLNYWSYGGDLGELATFYREQMPLLDWSLRDETQGSEPSLVFEKGDEECRVELDASTGVTYVRIVIMPKST